MNRTRLNWTNLLFLTAAHLLAGLAIVYLCVVHFSWWTIGFGFVWGVLCTLSISGGYHRLFAHSAYRAAWPLRAFYLAFGAASAQNSALSWAADHRIHHTHTDREEDPYSISRGFWWAHIGWVVYRSQRENRDELVRDLEADPLQRFQDRHYVPLAVLFGALVPMAIGTAWGDPIGAFLVGCWLRLVVQWHVTFSVNSFAHLIGKQTYSRTSTARDSFLLALVTLGEGYHNFHHRFQADYRNGVRWHDFDPTKWWIWSASRFGLARDLRRAPAERVEAARRSARLQSTD
jgi:stearoyl-CoA desaturase (delta-9 desaturase)